jgi:hypothetical protein
MIIYLYLYIFCWKNKRSNHLHKNLENLLMTRKVSVMAHQLVVTSLTVPFHCHSPCGTDKFVTNNECYLSWSVLFLFADLQLCGVYSFYIAVLID